MVEAECKRALMWRKERGLFRSNEALRVFHGPGEGSGLMRDVAVDCFGVHCYVTYWMSDKNRIRKEPDFGRISRFYIDSLGVNSVVVVRRAGAGQMLKPEAVFGTPPLANFEVHEEGAKFLVNLMETQHTGLFLDHVSLRKWLRQRSRDWDVLNTFSYTGSLSVAAGLGGASHVTSVDLSKNAVNWARENWKINGLPEASSTFVVGDVFDWLGRYKKRAKKFDCVILDPPSFSRGESGAFSTMRDLVRLHKMALEVVSDGGVLVTSINSANISRQKYKSDILLAAKQAGIRLEILAHINLPETFPVLLGEESRAAYLKGWCFHVGGRFSAESHDIF